MRAVSAELAVPSLAPALASPTFAISALQCADHAGEDACRYQVAWAINPHMEIGAVDFDRAAAQHLQLVATLDAAGAVLQPLPFVHGAYDSVFVKDPALLLARGARTRAVLARFRHAERTVERTARARYYAEQGFEIVSDDHGPMWEGGDVVMLPAGDGMYLGYGLRSEREAAPWLEHHAGVPVWPLELRDPHLYHLDTALAVLPDGTALVCPWALTSSSLRLLEQLHAPRRVVHVSREVALEFGLNLVAIGDTIVVGGRDRGIARVLGSLGYRCVVVPLEQFHLAGGSAACLVATVHPDPSV